MTHIPILCIALITVLALATFLLHTHPNQSQTIPTASRATTTKTPPQNLARFATSDNIILKRATILTAADDDQNVITNGVIVVCKGRIVFVGTAAQFKSFTPACEAPTLRLHPQDVIVPAFINAHSHAAMALFKNLGNDRDLSDWLTNFIFPLEAALVDENFCRVGAKLAMAEFLASGVSTFADMYFFQDAVAEEVVKVGMRAMLGEGIIDFPQPDSPTPQNTLDIGRDYIQKWVGNQFITPFLAPHSPYTTSEAIYKKAIALNREFGVPTWSHCAETQDENANFRAHQGISPDSNITAIAWLRDIGALGSDVTCAHSVWLTDDDIDIYKQTGTKAAHCPSSNLKLASGFMRYTAMNDAGIPISFGTDGQASNNDGDLVEEAKLASLIHKGVDLNPRTLPALDALKHLTMGGAKAIGRESEQGSIEVGKVGDFAIFRGTTVKWTPRFDILGNGTKMAADTAAIITYNSNAHDVKGTVVNGRLLYFEGQYTTLRLKRVLRDAKRIGKKIRSFLASGSR